MITIMRNYGKHWALVVAAVVAGLTAGCAVSPTGRHQLVLISHDKIAQLGNQSYAQLKQKTPIDQNNHTNQVVDCVANAITSAAYRAYPQRIPQHWQVTVFNSKEVNAFALPGGNIGVYSALLKVTKNQAQLATVLGHEVGHVVSHHADERVSEQVATQGATQVAAVAIGGGGAGGQAVAAALGLGTQVGILLPFSRAQEAEADEVGLQLMARAGFDPRESVDLWREMSQQGGQQPPALLSTHPSNGQRIQDLQKHMPQALKLYRQAKAAGHDPACGNP